jgi:hypothetical protein
MPKASEISERPDVFRHGSRRSRRGRGVAAGEHAWRFAMATAETRLESGLPIIRSGRQPPRQVVWDERGRRAIVILGRTEPDEETLRKAESFDEVFVLERAVPDPHEQYLVDEERAYHEARKRLQEVLERLAADGVRAHGMVGDEDAQQAIDDAEAFFPQADEILIAREP